MIALSALRPPLRVLAPINEVKEVLIHISTVTKICLTRQTAHISMRRRVLLFVNAPFLDIFA